MSIFVSNNNFYQVSLFRYVMLILCFDFVLGIDLILFLKSKLSRLSIPVLASNTGYETLTEEENKIRGEDTIISYKNNGVTILIQRRFRSM